MRITVNLRLFFHDHRSLARIFISENIKCIKDIEDRIEEIFHINNFYLKCENQYLPPSENVHILNNDDIVWVIPKTEEHQLDDANFITIDPVTTEQTCFSKKKKKKKKKDCREESADESEPESLQDKKNRKGKKRKHERTESSEERIFQNAEDSDENSKSKRKKLKSKCKTSEKTKLNIIAEDIISKDSGRDSFDSSKSDETENQKRTINVKSLVHSFESQNSLKKCIENSFTPIPKRTNIVKTIIVSNKKDVIDTENQNQLECTLTESETSKLDSSQDRNNLSNIEKDIDTNNTAQTNIDVEKDDQQVFNFPKRKRKRVRKRKVKDNKFNVESTQELTTTPISFIPRPLLTKTASERHVRFKDNSEVIPSPVVTTVMNNDTVANNKNMDDDLKEKPFNEPVKDVNLKEVISNNELTEEFILKQPVMKNIQPRSGDIIAFRTLRISENYTPEVSARIVGKVCDYNLETEEVTFNVISGKDQCTQPQGKFSLDFEEGQPPEEQNDSVKFNCIWSSLIDPRLLYP